MESVFQNCVSEFDLNFLDQTANANQATPGAQCLISRKHGVARIKDRIKGISQVVKKAKNTNDILLGVQKELLETKQELEETRNLLFEKNEEYKVICDERSTYFNKVTECSNEILELKGLLNQFREKDFDLKLKDKIIQGYSDQMKGLQTEMANLMETKKQGERETSSALTRAIKDKTTLERKLVRLLNDYVCPTIQKRDKWLQSLIKKYLPNNKCDSSNHDLSKQTSEETYENVQISLKQNEEVAKKIQKLGVEIEFIDRPHETTLDDMGSPTQHSMLNRNISSDFKVIKSVDTGRGSSLACSDGDKSFRSSDHYMNDSPSRSVPNLFKQCNIPKSDVSASLISQETSHNPDSGATNSCQTCLFVSKRDSCTSPIPFEKFDVATDTADIKYENWTSRKQCNACFSFEKQYKVASMNNDSNTSQTNTYITRTNERANKAYYEETALNHASISTKESPTTPVKLRDKIASNTDEVINNVSGTTSPVENLTTELPVDIDVATTNRISILKKQSPTIPIKLSDNITSKTAKVINKVGRIANPVKDFTKIFSLEFDESKTNHVGITNKESPQNLEKASDIVACNTDEVNDIIRIASPVGDCTTISPIDFIDAVTNGSSNYSEELSTAPSKLTDNETSNSKKKVLNKVSTIASPNNTSSNDLSRTPTKLRNRTSKECIELNNSNTFTNDVDTDNEIEIIFEKMRLQHRLLTPIPATPRQTMRSPRLTYDNPNIDTVEIDREMNLLQTKLNEALNEFRHSLPKYVEKLVRQKIDNNHKKELVRDLHSTPNVSNNRHTSHKNTQELVSHNASVLNLNIVSVPRNTENNSNIVNENDGYASNDDVDMQQDLESEDLEQTINRQSLNNENKECEKNKKLHIKEKGRINIAPKAEESDSANTLNVNAVKVSVDDAMQQDLNLKDLVQIPKIDNIVNDGTSGNRQKPGKIKKLSKLEKLRLNMVPKGKIRNELKQPLKKPRFKPIPIVISQSVSKNIVTESDTAVSLNDPSVYENAVKVIAALKPRLTKEPKVVVEKCDFQVQNSPQKSYVTIKESNSNSKSLSPKKTSNIISKRKLLFESENVTDTTVNRNWDSKKSVIHSDTKRGKIKTNSISSDDDIDDETVTLKELQSKIKNINNKNSETVACRTLRSSLSNEKSNLERFSTKHSNEVMLKSGSSESGHNIEIKLAKRKRASDSTCHSPHKKSKNKSSIVESTDTINLIRTSNHNDSNCETIKTNRLTPSTRQSTNIEIDQRVTCSQIVKNTNMIYKSPITKLNQTIHEDLSGAAVTPQRIIRDSYVKPNKENGFEKSPNPALRNTKYSPEKLHPKADQIQSEQYNTSILLSSESRKDWQSVITQQSSESNQIKTLKPIVSQTVSKSYQTIPIVSEIVSEKNQIKSLKPIGSETASKSNQTKPTVSETVSENNQIKPIASEIVFEKNQIKPRTTILSETVSEKSRFKQLTPIVSETVSEKSQFKPVTPIVSETVSEKSQFKPLSPIVSETVSEKSQFKPLTPIVSETVSEKSQFKPFTPIVSVTVSEKSQFKPLTPIVSEAVSEKSQFKPFTPIVSVTVSEKSQFKPLTPIVSEAVSEKSQFKPFTPIVSETVAEKRQFKPLTPIVSETVSETNHENVVSYADLNLFSNEFDCNQDQNMTKENIKIYSNNFLCRMIQKYGILRIKYSAKKVPDSKVNEICSKLEVSLSEIIALPHDLCVGAMKRLVVDIRTWDMKLFLVGLIKYLKDPMRKIELFKKMSCPPAPPMTKKEQVLLYVIDELQNSYEYRNIVTKILTNIEYVLFALNKTPEEIEVIETMSHFYALLCRSYQKISKLRLFIIDAMYCLQYKSIVLIKNCLDVWMFVLPLGHMGLAKTSLVSCLVYLLHFYKCDDKSDRIQEIRNILRRKYNYDLTDWNEPKILDLFRTAITEVKDIPIEKKMLRLALIILAKRNGPKWCQNHIIKKMLQPIIKDKFSSDVAKRFCVSILGPLLKPYPNNMKVHCEMITDYLLDMLDKKNSSKMQEAIITSLLNMNKQNPRVIQFLVKWNPKFISPEFELVFKDYVRSKTVNTWKNILSSS